ncbi:ribonuclease H-like domain-containing protein, partial [Tanacetum coccineum]
AAITLIVVLDRLEKLGFLVDFEFVCLLLSVIMAIGDPSGFAVDLINNHDAGNPLYLQNNDNSSLAIVNVKLVGVENYKMWTTAIEIVLKGKNKMGFIDGTCVKAETSAVLSQQWERCNAIVLGWILVSLSQELYVGQVYFEIAFEVWTKLKENYYKMDGSVVFNLMHKFNSLKQGDLSVPDYYHKLNSLWREFDILTILPACVYEGRIACTCDAKSRSAKHTQLIRLMQFLMGLNDVYQPIRSTILAKDPLPNVKDAFYVVSREESHRGLHSGRSSTNKPQPVAFVAKTNNNSNNFNRRSVPNTFGSLSSSFTNEQMVKLLSLINEKPSRAANMSEQWLGWIIDSGANQHMTDSTRDMFNVVDISSLMLTIGLPNGTLAKISAIGNLRLSSGIVLFDVFVILEYNVCLLSVNKMIKDSKFFVRFDENKCYIQDLNQGKIVGTGSESNGLYLFNLNEIGKCVNAKCNIVFVCHVSNELWHCKLGHPADQVLSILGNKLGFSKRDHLSPCDICHKAKETREPFPLSDHKTKSVGDMIHCDV